LAFRRPLSGSSIDLQCRDVFVWKEPSCRSTRQHPDTHSGSPGSPCQRVKRLFPRWNVGYIPPGREVVIYIQLVARSVAYGALYQLPAQAYMEHVHREKFIAVDWMSAYFIGRHELSQGFLLSVARTLLTPHFRPFSTDICCFWTSL